MHLEDNWDIYRLRLP